MVPELVYGSVYAVKEITTYSTTTPSTVVGEVWTSADQGETWKKDLSVNANIHEILQVRIPLVK